MSMTYPDAFEATWAQAAPHTMTGKNRGFALFEAVNHVLDNEIPGMFVECGVWRGGSAMIIAATLAAREVTNRRIILFDTFEGMTEAGEGDRDLHGRAASDLLSEAEDDALIKARCDIETVRQNILSTGFPRERVGYVAGDVRKTLPGAKMDRIALLRLDTDFEDSTAAELAHLYPHVVDGGIVIIDDYGHWQGARKAVDEFLQRERSLGHRHFLVPLDYTGRLFTKTLGLPAKGGGGTIRPIAERYDYVAPGLADPSLLSTFTHLEIADPSKVRWTYLRAEVPHIWRTDARSSRPDIGVLSLDEAVLLHAAALLLAGQRGLEIGCHLGFSTAYLVKAGLNLDVIDPMLGAPAHHAAVAETLRRSTPEGLYRLHAGFSPMLLDTVFRAGGDEKWAFAFIDGLHDGDAPANDARAIAPHLAETAAVMFHDLASPDVAAGLRVFREIGWETRVYETMQVMGIAWRGAYRPPEHMADPACAAGGIMHLTDLHQSRKQE